MNKKIIIAVVVIIILASLIGILYFTITKKPIPFLNLNRPVVIEEKTVEEEMVNLINQMENLTNFQINSSLSFLEDKLPFTYSEQEFTDLDQVKLFIANKLIARDDYANKETFQKIYDFIFGGYLAGIRTDNFFNLNNYSYYQKFKNQCSDILKNDLAEYKIENFKANALSEGSNAQGVAAYDDFYACLSTLNKGICDNLQGEETINDTEVRSNKESCQLQAGSNLLNYFFFYSEIPCSQIDFSRIKSKCTQPPTCGDVCEIFRRQSTNLDAFNNSDKLRFQAFIDKNTDSCDIISKYEGLDAGDASECKKDVALWLANENKDLSKIREINQEQASISSKRLFAEYLIQNFDSISKELDDQVLKGSYSFSFANKDIADYCINSFEPIFDQACSNSIRSIENWFKVVAGQ